MLSIPDRWLYNALDVAVFQHTPTSLPVIVRRPKTKVVFAVHLSCGKFGFFVSVCSDLVFGFSDFEGGGGDDVDQECQVPAFKE